MDVEHHLAEQAFFGSTTPLQLLFSFNGVASRSNSTGRFLDSLCSSEEGWGPVAGADLHLTRCFVEGPVSNLPNFVAFVFVLAQLVITLQRPAKFHPSASTRLILQLVFLGAQLLLWICLGIAGYRQHGVDASSLTPAITSLSLLLVGALTYYERFVSHIASGALLFYWLFQVVTQLIVILSASVPTTGTLLFALGLSVLSFIAETLPRKRSAYLDYLDAQHKNPYDQANIFSRLTFTWMTPLMRKGYETFLTADSLPDLSSQDRADRVTQDLIANWDEQSARVSRPNLLKVLFLSFGYQYTWGGVFKLVQDTMSFVQPQLLRLLISFVEEYQAAEKSNKVPLTRGFYIAALMFLVSIIQTSFLHQYFERSFTTGMKVRTSLTGLIYRKSLRLSTEARMGRTVGDIVNLMSVDTQRLQDICPNGHIIWSAPFQIIICLISLHGLVGNAMWGGVIIMVVLVPINSFLQRKQKKLQQRQMTAKDLRTRLTSELFSSIKSIKLYAWEEPFLNRLLDARHGEELHSIRTMAIFGSFTAFLWNTAPFLVSLCTFSLYSLTENKPLTSATVFPAIALFNLLQFPLAMFPLLITNWIQASVAVSRVTDFLVSEELQRNAVTHLPEEARNGRPSLDVSDASFVWQREPVKPALTDISFEVKKGSLTCVVGRVGSGKSALLQAVLGDVDKIHGEVKIYGTKAYVAQSPWIFNGSVRENIVFGLEYDEALYQETIYSCALIDDFKALPDGDGTIVGEKGISLSGGQKARVTLARAVYARADVYLLDDPLSAVDEHVGRHIIKHVLGESGLLASRAVILATNSISVLKHAKEIVMLSGGRVIEKSSYTKAINSEGKIGALIKEFGRSASHTEMSSQVTSREGSVAPSEPDTEGTLASEDSTTIKSRRDSLRRPQTASFKFQVPLEVRKEHLEQGKVSWDVYLDYVKVCGPKFVILYLVLVATTQSFMYSGNIWLKHWSEVNTGGGEVKSPRYYLTIYALLGLLGSTSLVSQNLTAWLLCGLRGARVLHDRMLFAVVRTPMSFFETTPLGRIINRFSSDVNRVDLMLPQSFMQLFQTLARILFTMALISFGTPIFLLVVLPMGFVYYWYQAYYLRTSRELKRLESVSKSPIFAQFQESLDGVTTIRAFDQLDRFITTNENYLDGNNKAYFPSVNANRWLAVRLEFFGSIVILSSAALSILSLPYGRLSAGMIGLSLSYALSITQTLNWVVRMTVDVETNIVSVERVREYAQLTPEAPDVIEGHRTDQSWPSHGKIEIDDFSCRYRPELPLVLKNISLTVGAGEKIGIVGRTGAGKSSLSLALFRLIEASSGKITIDSVVTNDIGLKDLRGSLSIIPQDAQLFQGSMRTNLDPNSVHTDADLWRVLEISHLKEHVESMDGHLDAKVEEGGSNLSGGQRQLICLARAMLNPSKVLVLDEATAQVDVETDQLVQKTIREEFKDRTILTIAHRLHTIMDSDRVAVLSYGEIKEIDTPTNLLSRDSLFAALARQE